MVEGERSLEVLYFLTSLPHTLPSNTFPSLSSPLISLSPLHNPGVCAVLGSGECDEQW